MSFGQKIVQRRLELGLQQKDVAARMNVHPTTISAYERDRKNPTINTVRRFAEALECSTSDLIDTNPDAPVSDVPAYVPPRKRIDKAADQLNHSGLELVADVTEALTEVPRFQKSSDTTTPSSDTTE